MDMKTVVIYRLEELIRQKDITVNEAAIRSGVPPSTLKNILYGQSKNVGVVTIKKLCDALEMQEEIKRAIVRIDNDKKDLPIEAVVEIAPTDQKERQGVIAQKNDILKNIEAVNIEFEEKLNKTNYVSDFAQRDKFAFVSILRGLEKVGCFEKYRTYKEIYFSSLFD